MAKLEKVYAIRKVLVDNASVAAIVGARIYPVFNIPPNALRPYVTYTQSAAEHVHDLGGPSGGATYDIDVHCFAESDTAMRALGVAVRKALDGYLGTVTVGSDSVVIEQCHLQSEMDRVSEPENGGKQPVFIRQLEFKVFNKTETT
jgi:hypothetical protein